MKDINMTESQAILFVENLDVFEKAKIYMAYYVNMLAAKYTANYYAEYGVDKWSVKTREQFCDKSNIQINDTGCDDWKERGFASKSWTVLRPQSIYHYVYHKTK